MASNDYPVAVIGIACRVPHSENPSEFWNFIRTKNDAVGKFPSNRAKDIDHILQAMDPSKLNKPEKPYFTGSFFESIDKFDAKFFGISPNEAEFLDPQQRFFLRTAWEAFEDAGIAAQVSGSEIGVYVGDTSSAYEQLIIERSASSVYGNHPLFIAPRPAVAFDLRGPAVLVGTGCSSSLMAIHLACQALKNGDCKTAIAGGVVIESLPFNVKSDLWNLLKITSEDIQCTPFNENPKGTVKGEGSAAVVLKPLSEAIKDGSHIYGVIAGTSSNQNGQGNGLALPNPKANCEVMIDAWRKAEIEADDIDYFEAHGTGTKLGDPIEMLGIQMAFDKSKVKGSSKIKRDKPYLGSVKANIGHLADGGAGIIGFIKVLLSLEHETIPPQIHFETPNKMIDWKKCPFQINTESVDWKRSDKKTRVASVSSFGLVGTNVHLVVREFKPPHEKDVDDHSQSGQTILVSAATQSSLKGYIEKLRAYLKSTKNAKDEKFFKNIAYTLNVGREHNKFPVKSLICAKNIEEFNEKLGYISEHLKSKQVETFTVVNEKIATEEMKNDGFLCFAVDTKKKVIIKKSKQSGHSLISSGSVKLFKSLVNREQICWQKAELQNRKIVPLLPTYCFDEERFWQPIPTKGQTESDSAVASIISTEDDSLLDDKNGIEDVDSRTKNVKDNYRKTLTSLSKHIETTRNLSEDDLHFFSTLGDLLQVVQRKLQNSLEETENIGKNEKLPLVDTSLSYSTNTGELFLNFEIEEENLKNIEVLLKNNVRLVNHSPHTVVQSILKSKDCDNVHFQMLVFTDEMNETFLEQLSQVLIQTDKLLAKVPLIILELRLSPHSQINFSKTLQLKHRRIYSQTYEIQRVYQISLEKNQYDVPFNLLGYEYVSSLISRSIRAAVFPSPLKVIAVDADNTLWKGECSNERVNVEEHHLLLQEFLIKKYESGFLLILLSKNTESDIQNVFREQKDDLVITLDHFVEKRVNWNCKHQNLSDVCKEVNLSTDCVTFIDDNIHECVSMVTQHPSVLCLCFPSTLSASRGLLDNIWALDSFETTNDGKRRNEYYRQESERRETLKQQSLSEVLHSWKMVLKVFTSKISFLKSQFSEAFNRSQELIHRTNQFKMNTYAVDLLDFTDCKCIVLNLDDKFGSYGTVSVVVFNIENRTLTVEQWVTSCRALGRNVEHNIFRYLQTIAKRFDCEMIRIKFNRTEKNDPAFNFLREADFKENGILNGFKWMSSSSNLTDFVSIQTMHVKTPEVNDKNEGDQNPMQGLRKNSQFVDSTENDFKQNINACRQWIQMWPKELKSQKRIDCLNPVIFEEANEEKQRNEFPEDSVLSESWFEILGFRPTAKNHFFHSGGTSFKAVYFVSKLREKLELDIRLSHIYQNPTFGEMQCLLKSLDSLKRLIPETVKPNEYKLSSIQNTFVMLQEMAPLSTAYTEHIAVSGLFDDFNSEVLLRKILKHFPLLMSVVDENDSFDKIMSQLTEEEMIHSSILETASVTTKQAAICKARDLRPHFTLKNGEPMLKLLVIQIRNDSEANKMVVLYTHHILIDDVSLSHLEHCLQQILCNMHVYIRREVKGYNELTQIEEQYLNSEEVKRDLDTIDKSFETVPGSSSLGFSAEIWSDAKTYDCESKRFEITLNIEEICRHLNIRPFHYFLSCYLLTLKRYTAENDLLISVPITTRSHEYENAFGPFLNTVLFHYGIDCDNNLETFMQSVASKWFKTQDINRLPLEKVFSYLRDNGKIAGTALSSIFNYSALTKSEYSVYVPPLHARAPFYVSVREGTNKEVGITFEWATAFVDNLIAVNFGNSFVNICDKIAKNFDDVRTEPVSAIDVMCEQEYETIMNFNRKPNPTKLLLAHRFFEKHCKANGNKVAINCEDRSLTYNQINAMANKIAAYLQRNVNEADFQTKPIVILMGRTEMVIASIFAVWKVGGYFLTISQEIQERILQLEKNRKVTVDLILTNLTPEQIHVKIPGRIKLKNVNEIIREKSSSIFEDRLSDRLDPRTTTAYMFLTSGTTGEPKRCLITHQALNVFLNGFLNEFETDRFEMNVLQCASICFDVFLADLVISLLCFGGSMTIAAQKDRLDVDKVAKLMRDYNITCCSLPPQFATTLFSNLPKRSLQQFRMLIVCGEEFYQTLYQKLAEKLEPTTRIVNMWGLTETTLVSTFFSGPLKYLTSSAQVPIGRPLAGINIYVVDPSSKALSPIGTVGELCITGAVVGKGDVIATKLSVTGEDPVHFTGDKGRWLPKGDIDYIGRNRSTYLKIRGFRVNPREIELCVTRNIGQKLEHVRVFITEDHLNNRILCLVYKPKPELKSCNMDEEIRTIIKSRLPYFMVPNVVKCVNEIPLTLHEKTDENVLRKLCLGEQVDENVTKKSEINISATEAMLLKYLKASVSDSQPIDINLNFRDQGIPSLTLMKFANLMLNEKVPGFKGVVDLFDYPSIKLLAENIAVYNVTIKPQISSIPKNDDCKVAIVGTSFRLPKNVKTIAEYLKVVQQKLCFVDDFPVSRAEDYLTRLNSDDLRKITNKPTFKGAFLNEIDKFDNEFFGISTLEAKNMCPEQRLWMEVATEAITDSGHISNIRGSNFGVFMSFTDINYEEINPSNEAVGIIGKLSSFIPARTAYHFDMKGPTAVINSACSSGVVVLHQACEAIKAGTCDGAIVGGLHLILYPTKDGWMDEKMCIQSSDSRCRPFDANCNGMVPGEGVIALVLEPLQKAIDNNRFIYGIIESTSVNSVGRGNGITAPSVSSQKDLITAAINCSSLSRSDIRVIEAHGSGTKLGDTIELTALQEVFKENSEPVYVCGSKSKFGHLNEASGFLGVLNVLTALVTREVPATVNFEQPNCVLRNSNLLVPTRTVKLDSDFAAGVSAFGLSGTNGHVIFSRRDIPQPNKNELDFETHPLLLSCYSIDELRKQIENYYDYIKLMVVERNITSIADICATVCRSLKNTAKRRNKSDNIRLVFLLRNEQQSLKLLAKLKSVDDSELRELLKRDPNVVVSAKGSNTFIDTFITEGVIESDFMGTFKELRNAPCLPLSIFQSVRHWPEACLQRNERKDSTGASSNAQKCKNICLKSLLERQLADVEEMVLEVDLETTAAAQEAIDRFSSACIGQVLRDCSMEKYWEVGKTYDTKEIFKKTKIVDMYFCFFRSLMRHLAKCGIVRSNKVIYDDLPDNFTILVDLDDKRMKADLASIAEDAIQQYPCHQDCFKIVLHNMKTLKDVLFGKTSSLSILFNDGDFNYNSRHYRIGDPLGSVYMKKGIATIAKYVKKLAARSNRKICVLEIGGGFGQLTEQLVPKFADTENIEYWFTDIGKTFVNKAKKVYSEYSRYMKYGIFDITKPAEEQGIPTNVDVIIAYNVVHTTETLMEPLKNLTATLSNNGTMFLFETTIATIWMALSWGTYINWWSVKDFEFRSEALCRAPVWEKVLKRLDFKSVYSWPANEEQRKFVSRFMFVCCKQDVIQLESLDTPNLNLENNFVTQNESEDKRSAIIKEKKKPKNEVKASTNKKSYEEILAALKKIWISILGVEYVEEDDRFAELGGESLLTIEMMHNVRNEIGVDLQLAHCYAYPSLQELASFIETMCDDTAEPGETSDEVSSDSGSENEDIVRNDELERPQFPEQNNSNKYLQTSDEINSNSSNIKLLLEKHLLELHEMVGEVDFSPKGDEQETIDRYGVACIAQLLKKCCLEKHWRVGKTFDTKEIFKKTKIKENYFHLFRVLLRHLSKFGIIKCNKVIYDNLPEKFTVLVDLNDKRMSEDPTLIAQYGIKTYSSYQDCFKIAQHCMKTFKDVLTGKLSPLSVLFNDGDFDFNSRHDKVGDPLGSIYIKKGVAAIADHVNTLAEQNKRTIRVLEIGAGFGQLTQQLVPKLADIENVEYWFTDVGKTFINKASKVYSKYARFMKYGIFDITKPAEEQGIPADFDVIVAFNVVHVTESLVQTCQNMYSTLNNTGVMFTFETVRPNIWITFGWGIFDGWWLFKDCELRSEALCSADNWEEVWKQSDFRSVYTWPQNNEEKEYVSRFMFVCSKEENGGKKMEKTQLRFDAQFGAQEEPQVESIKSVSKKLKRKKVQPVKPKQPKREVTTSIHKKSYEEIVTALKKIWETILGVDDVEENDRFGELGGESLLTIEMMHNVRKEIGVDLQLAHCYAYPSLQELASFIETMCDDTAEPGETSDEVSSDSGSELEEMVCNDEFERQISSEPQNTEDTLLMFCGQGAQKETMLSSLFDNPTAMEVFEESKKVTGVDILKEFKNKENLKRTDFLQIALFVGCVAKIMQIKSENPRLLKNVKAVAGLSVGQIAALTYAEVLSFADALRLVYKRGNAMQDVVDTTPSAMTSILGPTREELTTFLEDNFPNLCISGYLADNQHTVAGDESTIDEFLLYCSGDSVINDLKLTDVRKLRVPGAFHTDFMQSAALEIDSLIDSLAFKRPKIPVILDINGKVTTDPKLIKEGVKKQLCGAIEWKQTIVSAVKMGIGNFIEISPSPILTAIIRRRIQECVDSNCTATCIQF